jgi:hypothetical protein
MAARGSPCLGRQPALWQRPGAYPVGAGQGEPGRVAAERLQAAATLQPHRCRERAIVSERKRGLRASTGDEARGAYSRTQRQAQACVGYFFAKARHLPGAVMAGRVFANARTRGMLCRAGLDIMGNHYASVAKSTMIVVVIAPCCIGAVFHRVDREKRGSTLGRYESPRNESDAHYGA